MPNGRPVEDDEKITARGELHIVVGTSIVGTLAPAAIEAPALWYSHGTPEIISSIQDIIKSGLLYSALLFFAVEIFKLLGFFHKVRSSFDSLSSIVRQTNIQNDVHNTLTQSMLKAFEHKDENVRAAIVPAFRNFLDAIEVSDEKIVIEGNLIAVSAYNNFWQLVCDTQKLSAAKMTVYVTHSSAIRIWLSSSSSTMKGIQSSFIRAGGEIVRMVVRNKSSQDPYSVYAAAIQEMRGLGMNVFFYDASHSSASVIHEYMIVRINDLHYVLVWRANWDEAGQFGDITGCKIYVGRDKFYEYWYRWISLAELWKQGNIVKGQEGEISEFAMKILLDEKSPETFDNLIKLP